MPVQTTYPGVYIEEIPSGVRTITGVATSITAFLGRAVWGPLNEPILINSYADFERKFGGLNKNYLMSYAVRDFYLNGGSQAVIVRLIHPNFATSDEHDAALGAAQAVSDAAQSGANKASAKKKADDKSKEYINETDAEKNAAAAVANAVDEAASINGATLDNVKKAAKDGVKAAVPGKAKLNLVTETDGDDLVLEAVSEGEWGNNMLARVDYEDINDTVADRFAPLTKDDLFNLTVRNLTSGTSERYLCVTVKQDNSRFIEKVLKNGSSLARVNSSPQKKPKETDDVIQAELQVIIDNGNKAGATDDEKKAGKDASDKKSKLSLSVKQSDTWRFIGVLETDTVQDGGNLDKNDISEGEGFSLNKKGLYALEKTDIFNLLCIPPDTRGGNTDKEVYQSAMNYCVNRRALLIVDPTKEWEDKKDQAANTVKAGLSDLGLSGEPARNAAIFFPRVIQSDPRNNGQFDTFVPCGIVAGIMARTDVQRGVWKAPAGIDASISGIEALNVNLTDDENGILNPLGINRLRSFLVIGKVVWGSRTLRGADQLADDYKYIPVRRSGFIFRRKLISRNSVGCV